MADRGVLRRATAREAGPRHLGRRFVVVASLVVVPLACDDPLAPDPPFPFLVVAAGGRHSCGIATDSVAYCWGSGRRGQLGNGSHNDRFEPTPVSGGLRFLDIGGGVGHSCGLTVDAMIYCWGWQAYGQRGNAYIANDKEPVPTSKDLRYTALAVGWYHSCGITTSGDTYCWGYNEHGQVGNGARAYRQLFPELVQGGVRFVSITAGAFHTCGLAEDGKAWCWGLNTSGQLGTGDTNLAQQPRAVARGFTYVSLSAGFDHTCGVRSDGVALCWGGNGYGQLGDGARFEPGVPAHREPAGVTGGFLFTFIDAGLYYTCAANADGRGMCWGRGVHGQLGNGWTIDHATPQFVYFDPGTRHNKERLRFSRISAGGLMHTCGLTEDQGAFCWGTGHAGELGVPGIKRTFLPVRVEGPAP